MTTEKVAVTPNYTTWYKRTAVKRGFVGAAAVVLALGAREGALFVGVPIFPEGPFMNSFAPMDQTGYNGSLKQRLGEIIRPEITAIAGRVLDDRYHKRLSVNGRYQVISVEDTGSHGLTTDVTLRIPVGQPLLSENVRSVTIFDARPDAFGTYSDEASALIDFSLDGDGTNSDAYAYADMTAGADVEPDSSINNMPQGMGYGAADNAIKSAQTVVSFTNDHILPHIK